MGGLIYGLSIFLVVWGLIDLLSGAFLISRALWVFLVELPLAVWHRITRRDA